MRRLLLELRAERGVVGDAWAGELLVVLLEHLGELVALGIVRVLVLPRHTRLDHVVRHARQRLGHIEAEDRVLLELNVLDRAIEDRRNAGAGGADRHALAHAHAAAAPACVDEVGVRAVLLELLREEVGVPRRVDGEERRAEARREGRLRLGHASLGARDLGRVARQKLVHGLAAVKLGDWREDAERVAGEEDNVLRVAARRARLVVRDVVDRVRDAAVLGLLDVEIVRGAVGVEVDVLEHGVALDGAVDVGLGLLRQVDGLGVATTLKVEGTIVIPAVLVVTDQVAVRVGREGGLASAREAEEEGGVAVLANVGRAVHGHDPLKREPVVHQREDSLLVLAAVPGAEDDRNLLLDVDGHRHLRVEPVLLPLLIHLRAGVDDREVRVEVGDIRSGLGADEHVGDEVLLPCQLVHEADLLLRGERGAAESVEHVGFVEGVEVVDGLLEELVEHLRLHRLVHLAPPTSDPRDGIGSDGGNGYKSSLSTRIQT
mmetsp:Transcript_92923/g.265268  ORF Transcript_92923/g.265268 Transcript_92923/m.265268 type:complete len:489 (-) Transcript_92923:32-1498(-)